MENYFIVIYLSLIIVSFSSTIPGVDKSITIIKQSDRRNSAYVSGTAEERLSMVWPLTSEAVSLGKKYDVEQRLQRHIINIVKKKG